MPQNTLVRPDDIELHCINESDTLRQVIIGYPYNFRLNHPVHEIVNATQAQYAGTDDDATAEKAIPEFHELKRIMEKNGIKVLDPDPCAPDLNVPDQLTPRDIGFVIGDTFYLSNMMNKSRKNEWKGIEKIISRLPKTNVVTLPPDIVIEGGDIIVDKGNVYVGISQRTGYDGYLFLQKQLAHSMFHVIPVKLATPDDDEDCLHLDCVFMPIGNNYALMYKNGVQRMPFQIEMDYNIIPVSKQEQQNLATNVLALSPTTIVSRDMAVRINDELRKAGFTVITMQFDQAPKTGGSFRCCTLPLVRHN